MAKLSNDEKIAIQKISAVAKKDKLIIQDLLYSLLCYATKETYKGKKSFTIPFICTIDFKETEVLNVKEGVTENKVVLTATPLQGLIDEIDAIVKDKMTPSEKYIKKRIFSKLKDLLEIDDLDLEEDDF